MAIALDSTSNSGYQAASSSYSWSHTCGGSYRILVVSVAMLNAVNEVSSITYNSVALTKLRTDVDGTGVIRTDVYYLVNPKQGTNTVQVTLNTASVSGSSATSYAGVDPDNPVDAQAGTTGTTGAGGGSSSLSVTTVNTGAWILDAIATPDTSISATTGQSERNNITGALGSGGQSDKGILMSPGATTMGWDNIGALTSWTMSAMSLKPFNMGTTTSTTSVSTSSTSTSSTSSSISSTSSSTSSTSKSTSTSSTSSSFSITTLSTSSTSSSISSTSSSSTSSSTSISSTSSSISSTSFSSTSQSSTSSSTSQSSTSSSISSTSSSISSTSASTSSTSFSSTSSSSSTSTTTLPPPNITYSYEDRAPTTYVIPFYTSGTWVCPANVTSVSAECWGAGGGGGGSLNGSVVGANGGGGGGGAYSSKVISVTAGTSYTVTVGAGGTAGTGGASPTAGGDGTDTSFVDSLTVLAKAGLGGGAGTGGGPGSGGAGGVAASGVGTVTKSGGSGGAGSAAAVQGGGGAGSAGTNINGGDGVNTGIAGIAGAPLGAIGGTGANGGAGNMGKAPGSGGGGAGSSAGGSNGAAGAGGLVQLTYTTNSLPSTGANLTNSFTVPQYGDLSVNDGDYFVEFGSEYVIAEFKQQNPRLNNTDNIRVTWSGRSTECTTTSPFLLQIYNQNSAAWETIATENRIAADVDFQLQGSITTNLSNYYDSGNQVTARVYQQVI